METKNDRYYWIDLLRILSTFAVIGLHICSGGFWYQADVNSSGWIFTNFYGSLTKCAVPIFAMISGMIFLNPKKEVAVKSVFTKYLPRMIISYTVWSVIYVIYSNWRKFPDFDINMLKDFFIQFINGHYHMWYIYMLSGLYLITPLLKKIVSNCSRRMLEYFLLLWLVFSIAIPTLGLIPGMKPLVSASNKLGMGFVGCFVGYYVLGYYLSSINITKKLKWIFYSCGIVGAVATVGITTGLSFLNGVANRSVHGNTSITVAMMAVGWFALFKCDVSTIKLSGSFKKIISEVNACSFGIYLCHPIILALVIKFGLKITIFHPAFSVPVMVVVIFLISFIFTWIIRRIKFVRRYLS